MLLILLPFLLLTSTLAAPSTPPLPGHMHRLGRRSRTFLPPIPERHLAHAGRLSGSRVDIREQSPAALSHDVIPDSGEVWDLADVEPLHTGFVLQAEAEGRRGAPLGEEIMTRAWAELIRRPKATGRLGTDAEGDRRSWSGGEYVGDLHEPEGEEGTEGKWMAWSWIWAARSTEGAGRLLSDYWSYFGPSSSPDSPSPTRLEPSGFQIAPKATVPEGGWAVTPRGQWYLVHLE